MHLLCTRFKFSCFTSIMRLSINPCFPFIRVEETFFTRVLSKLVDSEFELVAFPMALRSLKVPHKCVQTFFVQPD